MAINKIGSIKTQKIQAYVFEGRQFKSFNPRKYLEGVSGFSILSSMSIRDIAGLKLEVLAGVRNMGNETAARLIASSRLLVEGLDIAPANFEKIASKMAVLLLNAPEIYMDMDRVSKLSRLMGERMGFPKELVDELGLAGLLHDIGKAAEELSEKFVEVASARVHEKFKPLYVDMTLEEATLKMYSVRDTFVGRTPKDISIYSFVNEYFPAEADKMLKALRVGLHLNTDEVGGNNMDTFYRLHTYISSAFLKNKVSENVRIMIASHHLQRGVNPLNTEMFQVELGMSYAADLDPRLAVKETKNDLKSNGEQYLWPAAKVLIFADIYDAIDRRSASGTEVRFRHIVRKNTTNGKLSAFHDIIRFEGYLEDNEFNEITRKFSSMVRMRDPGLIELGIIR